MLFRKPNRRRRQSRKSSEIPAVESVEGRLLLSAVSGITSATQDSTDLTRDASTWPAGTAAASDTEMILTSTNSTDIEDFDAGDAIVAESDVVLDWNDLFGGILVDSTENQNPGYASRSQAMLNLAIYDAVAIATNGSSATTFYDYKIRLSEMNNISAEVAASQAAYTVLSSLYPDQQATLDAILAASPAGVTDDGRVAASAAIGMQIGNAILAFRANDGSDAIAEYEFGDDVGDFQADPLNPDVPTWGPAWGEVETFAISSSDDFLPETTPSLTSEEYAASYNEVLELGSVDSEIRTADQTEAGIFWAYDREGLGTPIALFNDILQTIAVQEGNTLEENAALFAQASVAMADAGITAWDTKFTEEFWRPVTAIHAGDADDNSRTEGDPDWVALGAPDGEGDEIGFTPQFPTYISGHATFGAALFGTLQDFYGTDDISFDVTSTELEILLDDPELQEAYGLDLDDATRSFDSFSEAMAENGRSRVYLGIHFDFDDLVGQEVGQAIAASVSTMFTVPSTSLSEARVDLADAGSNDVTVRASDDRLEVVDNQTRTVVSSWSLANLERVVVTGLSGQSDRIFVAGLTAADLPGGISINSGNDAGDTLVIRGRNDGDTIVVDNDGIDVNGLTMEVAGIRRVIVQATDRADTVEVAEDVSFRVDIVDGRRGNGMVTDDRGDNPREKRRGRSGGSEAGQHAAVAHRERQRGSGVRSQPSAVKRKNTPVITAAPPAASARNVNRQAATADETGMTLDAGSPTMDEAESQAALDRFFAAGGLHDVLERSDNRARRR